MDEVERVFIETARNLLPGSFIGWNLWTLDLKSQLVARTSEEYAPAIARLIEPLNAVVRHHPLITQGGWKDAFNHPQRMSDYQGYGEFKHNPLFREVYRHLDSHFQLTHNIMMQSDRFVCLTWNRHYSDFTDRDRDILKLIGRRLDVIIRGISERQRLERACGALNPLLIQTSDPATSATLSNTEGRLLAGLLRGKSREEIATTLGWRRDTLDRRLASVRERLGFENTSLLLRALAETKPPSQPTT